MNATTFKSFPYRQINVFLIIILLEILDRPVHLCYFLCMSQIYNAALKKRKGYDDKLINKLK